MMGLSYDRYFINGFTKWTNSEHSENLDGWRRERRKIIKGYINSSVENMAKHEKRRKDTNQSTKLKIENLRMSKTNPNND